MPGPNLLDALKAHLTTGEIPESLRESLGGGVRTVPIVEQSGGTSGMSGTSSQFDTWHAAHAGPRRSGVPRTRDAVRASSQKLGISELEGGSDVPTPSVVVETNPAIPARVGERGQPDLGVHAEAPLVTTVVPAVVGAVTAVLGVVPPRVTPAGEVEPPLPFATRESRVTAVLSHAQRRREWLDEHAPPDSREEAELRQVKRDHTKAQRVHERLTTDQTLAEDLAASLALTGGEVTFTAPGVCPLHGTTLVQRFRSTPDEEGNRDVLTPIEEWDCLKCLLEHPKPEVVQAGTGGVLVDDDDDPAAEATLGVLSSVPTPSPCEIPTSLDELPLFGYVCGAAGVGKTYWAKEVARLGGDAVVLCATTGIASVNLGEGTTINTLLRYYDTSSLRESYTGGYLEAMLKKHRATGLERILLDEVSMMAGEQLTILTRAIDNVNQDKPEGVPDLGLILLGDFAQLAPVPDRDPRDPRGFKKLPVQFAFESAEWDRYGEHTLKLTQIRRQADRDFVEALQAVRRGAVGEALGYFGPRMVSTTDMQFQGPTIVAKNDAVAKYNQLRLDAVTGARIGFPSTRWGKVRPEWGGPPKPEADWGVPPVLQLKEGCRVMVLANKNVGAKDGPPEWAYTNGDLGTFLGPQGVTEQLDLKGRTQDYTAARVRLDRTGTEVVVGYLQRFNEIPLEPGRRKALKAEGHPERVSEDGKKEYVGGIGYVPLRLAYCTTVHKSQGLSLDQVQINIRDSFFAQPGMLYVALSRARSVEGLRLVGSPEGFRARCTVNPKLKGYL